MKEPKEKRPKILWPAKQGKVTRKSAMRAVKAVMRKWTYETSQMEISTITFRYQIYLIVPISNHCVLVANNQNSDNINQLCELGPEDMEIIEVKDNLNQIETGFDIVMMKAVEKFIKMRKE